MTCTTCHGARGYTETTPGPDGKTVHVWHPCTRCGGTGVLR